VSTDKDPSMFSDLTADELTAPSVKVNRAAETVEAPGCDPGVTSEVHGVQADLYDAKAALLLRSRRR
jgi:hypothetical protein